MWKDAEVKTKSSCYGAEAFMRIVFEYFAGRSPSDVKMFVQLNLLHYRKCL